MSFFLAAIYLGFKMVDRLVGLSPKQPEPPEYSNLSPQEAQIRWKKLRKTFQILAAIFLVLTLSAYLFSDSLREAIRNLVTLAYQADSHSLLGRLFDRMAGNA
jgi:hypothetical protein